MKVEEALDEITDDDKGLSWFPPVRRPSFSELLQERFLLSLQADNTSINQDNTVPGYEDLQVDECAQLIEEGLLIEENKDNLKYLLKHGLVKRDTEY